MARKCWPKVATISEVHCKPSVVSDFEILDLVLLRVWFDVSVYHSFVTVCTRISVW